MVGGQRVTEGREDGWEEVIGKGMEESEGEGVRTEGRGLRRGEDGRGA